MARSDRKQQNVFLTEEAFNGWRDFCAEQGCSVTALVEALGRRLAGMTHPGGVLTDAIREARRIDSENRKR